MERCVYCQGELDAATGRCLQCQRPQPATSPPAPSSPMREEPEAVGASAEPEDAFSEAAFLARERARPAARRLSRRTLLLGLAGLAGVGLTGGVLGRLIYVFAHQQGYYTYRGHAGEGEIDALEWSPDSQRIASGASSLQLWDALSGGHVHTFPAPSGIQSVAWSADGKYLASGFWDFTASVWEVATGQKLLTYRGHLQEGTAASFHFPSMTSLPREARLRPAAVNPPGVASLAWSPDGSRLLSTGGDGTAQVWEALTGKQLFRFGSRLDFFASAAWSPDGDHLLMWTRRGIELHDATSGTLLVTYPIGPDTVSGPSAYSPDGKYLATINDQELHLWELATGRQVLTYQGHSQLVAVVAWSPDSKRVVSGGFDLMVQVWDAASGQTEYTYLGHMGFLQQFFTAADPPVQGHAPQTVRSASALSGSALVRRASGQLPQDTYPSPARISALAWAPNGRYIASGGSDTTVQIWQPG